MKKFLIAAFLFVSGSAHAASWTIDKAQSTLGFTGTQTGTKFDGSFTSFAGTIDFDPAHPEAGHAAITIDIASARTGGTQRDDAIPQPEWFDVKKFPQAKFEASSFKSLGGDKYQAIGTLSIRDVKKDVTLPFTITIAGNTATADGTLPLVRTDYGVGQGEWSSGQWVGLDVDVKLHVMATRK